MARKTEKGGKFRRIVKSTMPTEKNTASRHYLRIWMGVRFIHEVNKNVAFAISYIAMELNSDMRRHIRIIQPLPNFVIINLISLFTIQLMVKPKYCI